MRRLNREKDPKFPAEQLDRLLGVDFAARGTPLPPMFSRPEPAHTQGVEVDRRCLAELCEAMSHARFATIIVPLLLAVRDGDPLGAARAVPEITDETISRALELDYPLEEFMMYNVVEGFLYQSKQCRVDKENARMLRPDLGVRREGQEMCKEYVLSRYREDYAARLKLMAGEERKQLLDELVGRLLDTGSMADFCSLLSEGMQKGEVSIKIANISSYGCTELHDALMSTDRAVVHRAAKLQVFYTGESAGEEVVWNGGNMYRVATTPLEKLLTGIGEEAVWARILERYRSKVSHVYRGGACSCNRNGHSNDKPSYFAFGHESLVSYAGVLSPELWDQYMQEHHSCCGAATFGRDRERLQLAVQELSAKRARRKECESDLGKLHAAIKKTMGQRKERQQQQQQPRHSPYFAPGVGVCKGKGKVGACKGKGKGKWGGGDSGSDNGSDSGSSS